MFGDRNKISRLQGVAIALICLLALGVQVEASKIYKWVDDKGQTHFTTTPPSLSNTVPIKSSPKDMKIKKKLEGVWWSKDGDATVRIEFKANHVLFDTLRDSRGKILKHPYFLANYEVQSGRLITSYNFHKNASLRSQTTTWTLFEPSKGLVMLSRDGGDSVKGNWVLRRLKPLSKHPSGAPSGDWQCAQRPELLLKLSKGNMVWMHKKEKQNVSGGYVSWKSPKLIWDKVFDLNDPINPRVKEELSIEVMTNEKQRLILKLPSEEVLACKPS